MQKKMTLETLFTLAMAGLGYVVVRHMPSHHAGWILVFLIIWIMVSMHITGWGFKKRPPFCVECGSGDMELVDNVLVCRKCENQQAVVAITGHP